MIIEDIALAIQNTYFPYSHLFEFCLSHDSAANFENITKEHIFHEGYKSPLTFYLRFTSIHIFKNNIKNLKEFIINGGMFCPIPVFGNITQLPWLSPMKQLLLDVSVTPNEENIIELKNFLVMNDFPIEFWGEE